MEEGVRGRLPASRKREGAWLAPLTCPNGQSLRFLDISIAVKIYASLTKYIQSP